MLLSHYLGMKQSLKLRLAMSSGLLVVLTACGAAASDETAGVASASDLEGADVTTVEADTSEDAAAEAAVELTTEEAALALSVCMRDNGFADFPDPVIDDGAVNLRGALADSGLDFQDEDLRTQFQACVEDVGAENLGGGGGGRADVQNQAQENLLVYTQCLRDEGLDVGDLDFGNGAGGPGAGNAGAGGGNGGAGGGNGAGNAAPGEGDNAGNGAGNQGAGPGAGGGQGNRIAAALGLDTEDPATQAALTACEDVLSEIFAGVGGGPGGGPGAGAPAAANENDA